MKVIQDSFVYNVLNVILIPFFAIFCVLYVLTLGLLFPSSLIVAIRDNEKIKDKYNEMIKDFGIK